MLPTAKYRRVLEAQAEYLGLPAWGDIPACVWLEALVLHESSGNPKAYHVDRADPEAGAMAQLDASYGLMQVEGRNAATYLGHAPVTFDFLFYPLANLAFGLRILTEAFALTNAGVEAALAYYNGGAWGARTKYTTGSVTQSKTVLNNQSYVDAVAQLCPLVTADRKG
jgi:hypothetical protein